MAELLRDAALILRKSEIGPANGEKDQAPIRRETGEDA